MTEISEGPSQTQPTAGERRITVVQDLDFTNEQKRWEGTWRKEVDGGKWKHTIKTNKTETKRRKWWEKNHFHIIKKRSKQNK